MDVATVVTTESALFGYYLLVWVGAIIVAFIAIYGWLDEWWEYESKKSFFVILIILLICVGGIVTIRPNYLSDKQRITDETLANVENITEEFAEKKYFIKEMHQKDVFEIRGEMRGGFLLIGGSVYGEIEGTETKKMTLIYNENDTERHYIKTFLLEKISIVTVNENDTPYFAYNDAYHIKGSAKITVKSGEPVLYLPEGWQILGVKM